MSRVQLERLGYSNVNLQGNQFLLFGGRSQRIATEQQQITANYRALQARLEREQQSLQGNLAREHKYLAELDTQWHAAKGQLNSLLTESVNSQSPFHFALEALSLQLGPIENTKEGKEKHQCILAMIRFINKVIEISPQDRAYIEGDEDQIAKLREEFQSMIEKMPGQADTLLYVGGIITIIAGLTLGALCAAILAPALGATALLAIGVNVGMLIGYTSIWVIAAGSVMCHHSQSSGAAKAAEQVVEASLVITPTVNTPPLTSQHQ